MSEIKIGVMGIGSCSIEIPGKRLLVDAYNEYVCMKDLNEKDILLFTHADGDHFTADALKPYYRNNVVIGSPSVIMRLLESGFSKEHLICAYPAEHNKAAIIDLEEVHIKAFNTPHFLKWHTDHISFLLQILDKKIFITGDSYLVDDLKDHFTQVDLLIYNLIHEEVVKDRMDKKTGTLHHLAELAGIQYRYQPCKILCNHLMGCSWQSMVRL